jgi:hypothetical protein
VIVLDKIIVLFFIKKSQFSLVKGTNLNKYIQNGGQLYKLFSFVFMTQDIMGELFNFGFGCSAFVVQVFLVDGNELYFSNIGKVSLLKTSNLLLLY